MLMQELAADEKLLHIHLTPAKHLRDKESNQ